VAKGLAENSTGKKLIVIFLRGAADGLNIVVPYQEAPYYEARPTIALPPPGQEGGVINLDGYFGLHPALAPLMPLWQQRSLAFVHASGSPDPTRSHFDAQDYMETGTPGAKNTATGWLNRLLGILPRQTPVQAVNVGTTTPRILAGQMPVANLPMGRAANRKMSIDVPVVSAAFDRLYNGNDPLSMAYQEGIEARDILLKELDKEMEQSAQGAPTPVNFSTDARNLARLIRGDAKTQIGFIALGGWDSHINEKALLNRNLNPLAQGLTALVQELGLSYKDTLILVMSEFGRTVRENGNAGTDHGHGNVMWVLGGGIQGGKVYGQWPSLEESELYEGRDLAITTDFRDVLTSVLSTHLQLSQGNLAQLFPGYSPKNPLHFWA
jgi:uncharacterized protein (DUF1501 family)